MPGELIRLPVGPAVPHVPRLMAVPSDCRLVAADVLPGAEMWQQRHGGPWLLIAEDLVEIETPPEFFLRELLDVDASDDDALAAWCGRWGVPRLPPSILEDQIRVVVRRDVSALFGLESESPPIGHPDSAARSAPQPVEANVRFLPNLMRAAITDAGAQDAYMYDDLFFSGHQGTHWVGVPLAVARVSVQVLRALVRWWTWVVPPEITVEWLTEFEPDPEFFFAWLPFGYPANQLDGLQMGIELLNSLLAIAEPLKVRAVDAHTGQSLGGEASTIEGVVACELTRYIHDHIPARQCANETCGQMYVRQTGRADKGQYRTTATKYCSDTCARAQAQRALRRRRAAARQSKM